MRWSRSHGTAAKQTCACQSHFQNWNNILITSHIWWLRQKIHAFHKQKKVQDLKKYRSRQFLNHSILIDHGCCKWSSCKSNRTIGRVEDWVETLEERYAVYKIETFTARGIHISYNEIDTLRGSSHISVEGSRPDLSIRCQFVSDLAFVKWAKIKYDFQREGLHRWW